MAAFLPKYGEALRERFLARGADHGSLTRALESEALAEPKRPGADQSPPPAIVPNFAALTASLK